MHADKSSASNGKLLPLNIRMPLLPFNIRMPLLPFNIHQVFILDHADERQPDIDGMS